MPSSYYLWEVPIIGKIYSDMLKMLKALGLYNLEDEAASAAFSVYDKQRKNMLVAVGRRNPEALNDRDYRRLFCKGLLTPSPGGAGARRRGVAVWRSNGNSNKLIE